MLPWVHLKEPAKEVDQFSIYRRREGGDRDSMVCAATAARAMATSPSRAVGDGGGGDGGGGDGDGGAEVTVAEVMALEAMVEVTTVRRRWWILAMAAVAIWWRWRWRRW